MNGQTASFGQANYAAAKAGVIGFTKTTAIELARFNVTVNTICPGFIATDMYEPIPEKAKEAILARIPSRACWYASGGGTRCSLPRRGWRLLYGCDPQHERWSLLSVIARHLQEMSLQQKGEKSMTQREVVVLSGVRTAIGDYGGGLKDKPPTELAAAVLREAVKRAGIQPAEV